MPRKRELSPNKRDLDPPFSPTQNSGKVSKFDDVSDGISIKVHCSSSKPYNLGCFKINSSCNEILLPLEFIIKFQPDGTCFILFNENDNSNEVLSMSKNVYEGTYEIPYDILQLLKDFKLFNFYLHASKLVGAFNVDVYFDSSKFITLKEASELHYIQNVKSMYRILQFFLGLKFDVYENDYLYNKNQIEKIYECIKNSYNPKSSSELSHKALNSKLRPYQSQAVSWMLKQERDSSKFSDSALHQLYTAITLKDGHILYFHKYGGFFVTKKYLPDFRLKGGLLGDERGLGKKLEILSCIILNPKRDLKTGNIKAEAQGIEEVLIEDDGVTYSVHPEVDDPASFDCSCENIKHSSFLCVRCTKCKVIQHRECILNQPHIDKFTYTCPFCTSKEIVSTRSTLIICPASVLNDWQHEISKHIEEDYLSVIRYEGVEIHKYIYPKILSTYNVVLVSYETLKRELADVDIANGRAGHSLRNIKKSPSIPSPLFSIEWWRICLDNVQMGDKDASIAAKIVRKLHSINRWLVSGTLIYESVEDLYGLFLILDVKPFHEKMWWKEALLKPFVNGNKEPLSMVLNNIAWATMECQVSKQVLSMGNYKQFQEVKEVLYELNFSPIEKIYYDKKHSIYLERFMEIICKYDNLDINLQNIEDDVLHKILHTLESLQQICGHFHVLRKNLDTNKKMMSTVEHISKLIETVSFECEQILRQDIVARNDLADTYIIEEDYKGAIEIFEKTLQSIENNKEKFKTDVTQQIHCMFNLSNILKSSEKEGKIFESKFKPTELDEKVKELSESYNAKIRLPISTCKKDFKTAQIDVDVLLKKLKLKRDPFPISSWWSVVLKHLSCHHHKKFLERLHGVLEKATSGCNFQNDSKLKRSLLQCSVPAFGDLLLHWTSEIHDERRNLLNIIEDLPQEPDDLTMESAISCHLRPVENSPKCKYCKAEDVFKSYESKLYIIEESTTFNQLHSENNSTEEIPTRKRKCDAGPLEICLQLVSEWVYILTDNLKRDSCELYQDCSDDQLCELQIMDSLKKEFQVLHDIWRKFYDYVSGKYQIGRAKKLVVNMVDKNQKMLRSSASLLQQVQNNKRQYLVDISKCEKQLKRNLENVCFLQNLKKAEKLYDVFKEDCSICYSAFGEAWYVLQCGHCFCAPCVNELKRGNNIASENHNEEFFCPICRQNISATNLRYVTAKTEEQEEKEIPLDKFYSTKVDAVIKCLLKIKKEEPSAKSLVFSSFIGILDVVHTALKNMHVRCAYAENKANFEVEFQNFKSMSFCKVLLIPFTLGYSGLSITQAKNVLLLEPMLDTCKHEQAIECANRVGQINEVTVYRFLIKGTIEESMHTISTSASKEEDGRLKLTLMDLKNIFNKNC